MEAPLRLMARSADGARLNWHAWWPVGSPKAAVVVAHGYAEHLGRYDYLGRRLADRDLAVFAVDHWGHGRSDGTPGFVPRFSVYTEGVERLLEEAQRRLPAVPLFLIGHSMGGLIAATHLLSHQAHYAGAIFSGAAIEPAGRSPRLLLQFSRLLATVVPRLGVMALDAEGVSRDPAVVAAYRSDPLVYRGRLSARLAVELVDAMTSIKANASRIALPLLLLHGAADRLAAPAGSHYLHDHVGSTDRQVRLYPGLYHEIFNEPERDAVIADVVGWLLERL